jgi:uncharacterized protein YcfJ
MSPRTKSLVVPIAVLALIGCASIPQGPTVGVMPGPGKPFEVFQSENALCREYARQELGVDPDQTARQQVIGGAAAGAAIGAVSGVLLGHGHSRPVESMAGVGVLMGSAAGADAAQRSRYSLQRRYDVAYQQCMYAKGNQVPGFAAPSYVAPPPPRS